MLRHPSQSSTIVAADDGDLRVDDHVRLGLLLAVFSRIERRDKHAQPFVHLRRRQADAVILGHRVEHVVDELLHRRGLDIAPFDRPRFGPQHGMPHARDLQDGHDRGIILRVTNDLKAEAGLERL